VPEVSWQGKSTGCEKMFDLLTKPGSNNSNNKSPVAINEPHVTSFQISETIVGRFVVPFEWITYCLSVMILCAVLFWMWLDSTLLIEVAIWTLVMVAPLYFTGLAYYLRYYLREQNTRLEIDHKHCLIQYKNGQQNYLFRFDQVMRCDVTISTFLPYPLEYTTLQLQGDVYIHISNLIVDPAEMVAMFSVPYEVRRKMLNRLPVR
jgi:hypothetical protein